MSIITVAGAQIASELGDITANCDKHLQWIEAAKAQDVDFLVFPELSLTGYSIGQHGYALARDRYADELMHLADAAGDMTVVLGFMEEGPVLSFTTQRWRCVRAKLPICTAN